MFCSKCAASIETGATFCTKCGTAAGPAAAPANAAPSGSQADRSKPPAYGCQPAAPFTVCQAPDCFEVALWQCPGSVTASMSLVCHQLVCQTHLKPHRGQPGALCSACMATMQDQGSMNRKAIFAMAERDWQYKGGAVRFQAQLDSAVEQERSQLQAAAHAQPSRPLPDLIREMNLKGGARLKQDYLNKRGGTPCLFMCGIM